MSKKTKGSQVEDHAALASTAEAGAAAWVARLHADDCGPNDEAEFRAWLELGEANRKAFARLTEAWDLVGGLAAEYLPLSTGAGENGRKRAKDAPERVFGRGEE